MEEVGRQKQSAFSTQLQEIVPLPLSRQRLRSRKPGVPSNSPTEGPWGSQSSGGMGSPFWSRCSCLGEHGDEQPKFPHVLWGQTRNKGHQLRSNTSKSCVCVCLDKRSGSLAFRKPGGYPMGKNFKLAIDIGAGAIQQGRYLPCMQPTPIRSPASQPE